MKGNMDSKNICYKVVSPDLTSCIIKGKAKVQYAINKWAYPPDWLKTKGFYILCFSDYDDAKEFADYTHKELKILKRGIPVDG